MKEDIIGLLIVIPLIVAIWFMVGAGIILALESYFG